MVVRADATPTAGMGHVMRCLALMQAWSEQGGKAVLLGRLGATWLSERLQAEGIGWHDLRDEVAEDDGAASFALYLILLSHFNADSILISKNAQKCSIRCQATTNKMLQYAKAS